VVDLAVSLASHLLGYPPRWRVRRQYQGDQLLDLQLSRPIDGRGCHLGRVAAIVQGGLDAPGELDHGGVLDHGPVEAAAAGEGAGLLLDQQPGAEAVVGPVGLVAID